MMLHFQNGTSTEEDRWYDPYDPKRQFDDNEKQYSGKGDGWNELDMSGMGIRTLSPEIRLYSHITALYLSNNRLSYLPEGFFNELRQLVTLDLSFNHLTRLPPGIGQLNHLEKLLLQGNRLQTLPVEMGQLLNLKEITLMGNPLTSPPARVLEGGTGLILSYLRDRMPMGPPPPERRFISYLEPGLVINEREKFKVLSYNVLAEGYASTDRYYYCPSWALDWNYRKQGILKELLAYDCDILCLQEVESGQYRAFFQPEMAKAGYAGILIPKSRARTMEDWSSVDGCVIFYKMNKFNLVEEHAIEYQTIAMAKHKEFAGDPEAFSRVITKDNVGVAVILQFKDPEPQQNGNNLRWRNKPRYLLVSNTHIHWNPDHRDVKLIQVQLLLEQLSVITGPKTKWNRIPMVVCGDFNSSVGSGPYDLLSSGRLKPKHNDLQPFNYGLYSSQGMQHSLQLSSAYAPIGEPPFTNYTGDFVGVLDYLWFTQDSLGVSKVLQPVDEDIVKASRLPNAYMHSDHISILSEFFYKKK